MSHKRSHPNIDRSAFRRGEYVGYALGLWFVRRQTSGGWRATKREGFDSLTGETLTDISERLTRFHDERIPFCAALRSMVQP